MILPASGPPRCVPRRLDFAPAPAYPDPGPIIPPRHVLSEEATMRRGFRPSNEPGPVGRREMLRVTAGALLGAAAMAELSRADPEDDPGKVIKNGRIRQSIVHWCFAPHWDVPTMIG